MTFVKNIHKYKKIWFSVRSKKMTFILFSRKSLWNWINSVSNLRITWTLYVVSVLLVLLLVPCICIKIDYSCRVKFLGNSIHSLLKGTYLKRHTIFTIYSFIRKTQSNRKLYLSKSFKFTICTQKKNPKLDIIGATEKSANKLSINEEN